MASLNFSLPGGLSHTLVDRLQADLTALGRALGVDPDLLPIVATVVEEICTNIMEHSNASWLEVDLERNGGRIWVRVVDNGLPFNFGDRVHAQAKPTLQDRQERHLGLYMVKQLASAVHSSRDERGNNLVELEFYPETPVGTGPP